MPAFLTLKYRDGHCLCSSSRHRLVTEAESSREELRHGPGKFRVKTTVLPELSLVCDQTLDASAVYVLSLMRSSGFLCGPANYCASVHSPAHAVSAKLWSAHIKHHQNCSESAEIMCLALRLSTSGQQQAGSTICHELQLVLTQTCWALK